MAFNMERSEGTENDYGNDPPSEYNANDANETHLKQNEYSTRRRYYPIPENLDFEKVREWYGRYKAVNQRDLHNHRGYHSIFKELQLDELDEHTIEQRVVELAKEINVTNHFCNQCQRLFDDWPGFEELDAETGPEEIIEECTEKGTEGDTEEPVKILRSCHTLVMEAAMRKGCKFCAFLVQDMRDSCVWVLVRKIELRLESIGEGETALLSGPTRRVYKKGTAVLRMSFPGMEISNDYSQNIWIEYVMQDIEEATDTLKKAYDEAPKSKSDVISLVRSWMSSCSENHEECNSKAEGPLPTRLICVASGVPRLVLTAGWKTKPRYSTLSHCWGKEEFLQLSHQNFETFLEKIPFSELPQTFRDAITITRGLGIDYLWIDSLCIIQGHKEDWAQEAGKMSDVYGSSAINIAASSATNAHQGCFLKPENYVDRFQARISKGRLSFLAEIRFFSCYEQAVAMSHLATRAWTVQERLLSSRTIHLGDRGAYWECSKLVMNESPPFELPNKGILTEFDKSLDDKDISYQDLVDLWYDVILAYSGASLTYGKDKLPALSGIAKRVGSRHGWRYLAGIWQNPWIEEQLCWSISNRQKRPCKWRAPSWSWASVDGNVAIGWIETRRGQFVQFLDADVGLLSDDPFGEVCSGTLRMACSGMLVGTLSGTKRVKVLLEDEEADVNDKLMVSRDWLQCHNDDDDDGEREYVYSRKPEDEMHKQNMGEEQETTTSNVVYLLPMGEAYLGRSVKGMAGIMLRRTNSVPSQFKRIGTFAFDCELEGFTERLQQILDQKGPTVAENVAAEVIDNEKNPDLRYVITIV